VLQTPSIDLQKIAFYLLSMENIAIRAALGPKPASNEWRKLLDILQIRVLTVAVRLPVSGRRHKTIPHLYKTDRESLPFRTLTPNYLKTRRTLVQPQLSDCSVDVSKADTDTWRSSVAIASSFCGLASTLMATPSCLQGRQLSLFCTAAGK
jgi:hypothetical protein